METPKSKLAEYLATCSQCSQEEIGNVANALYAYIPQTHLPDALMQTINNVSAQLGSSGDVFVDVVIAWMNAGADKVLSYEEVISKS